MGALELYGLGEHLAVVQTLARRIATRTVTAEGPLDITPTDLTPAVQTFFASLRVRPRAGLSSHALARAFLVPPTPTPGIDGAYHSATYRERHVFCIQPQKLAKC